MDPTRPRSLQTWGRVPSVHATVWGGCVFCFFFLSLLFIYIYIYIFFFFFWGGGRGVLGSKGYVFFLFKVLRFSGLRFHGFGSFRSFGDQRIEGV